jgi:hypothetical protein
LTRIARTRITDILATIGRLARCNISGGDPQAGLELAAADLIRMARGRLAAIAATNAPNPTSS